jgi:hypothetical protein
LRLKGDIDIELAKIGAQADVIQTKMEWEAKVEIADVQAAADIIIGLSSDVSEMFASSGDVMVGLSGALADLSSYDRLQLFELLEEEALRRSELLALEKELTKAQVDYLEARTESMQKGDALVTIEANNLEPELQLVLHRIIELTQIRANEQGMEFLIGI